VELVRLEMVWHSAYCLRYAEHDLWKMTIECELWADLYVIAVVSE
jgi:hypothetical protein